MRFSRSLPSSLLRTVFFLSNLPVFLFTFSALFAIPAFAEQIEGHLHRDPSGLTIHLTKDHKIYRLASLTQEVVQTIDRLITYDFIRGQGEIRNDQILLETVDFIGLRKLIGSWSLKDGSFLTFDDFLSASFTIPDFIFPDKVADLSYSIGPGETDQWHIFFTNGVWIRHGVFEIRNSILKLRLYDSHGALKKPIELTKSP